MVGSVVISLAKRKAAATMATATTATARAKTRAMATTAMVPHIATGLDSSAPREDRERASALRRRDRTGCDRRDRDCVPTIAVDRGVVPVAERRRHHDATPGRVVCTRPTIRRHQDP